jgi:hypothetical protein
VRLRSLVGLSGSLLAVVALGATGCAERSAAAQVGDEIVSESDFQDEVDARAGNETYLEMSGIPADALEGDMESSYSQEFVGSLLQERIFVLLFDRILADEGIEVTADERNQAAQSVEEGLQEAYTAFPSWYQEQLVEDQSKYLALVTALESEAAVGAAVADMASRVDVELSSHYGSWDPDLVADAWAGEGLAIVPPNAPEGADTSETTVPPVAAEPGA